MPRPGPFDAMGGGGLRAPLAQKHHKLIESAVRSAARGAEMTVAEIRQAVNRALAKTAKELKGR